MSGDNQSRGPIQSRRRYLKATGLAGTVGLAGCLGNLGGGGGGGGGTTIDYWTLFGGGDGVVMESMVDKFNEEQPLGDDVTVDRQRIEWDEYYDRLFTSMTGGEAPDIAISHASYLNRFGDVLTPYNDYIDVDQTEDEYLDSHWGAVHIDDEVRGLPMDFHPVGIYYNKGLFEEAGLDPDDTPTNWEEFREVGDAIVENTDAFAWCPTPYMDGVGSYRAWSGWVAQRGGELFSEDLSEAVFDNEDGREMAQLFWDMTGDMEWGRQTSEENWGDQAFQNNQVAMITNGTWYVNVMAELEDFDWGFFKPYVAPGKQQNANWADGHTLILPQNPDRDDEKTEITAEFGKWLTQENPEWGSEAGHLPAATKIHDSGELESAEIYDKTLSKFLEMAEADEYFYHPQVEGDPNDDTWYDWLVDVWAHDTEPDAAIQGGQQRVNDALS